MRYLAVTADYDALECACRSLEEVGLCGNLFKEYLEINTDGVFVEAYEKDESVYTRKQYHKALGVVVAGELTSHKKIAGGDLVLRPLKVGDVFGVAAIFGQSESYVSEVWALSNAKVVYFGEDFLEKLFCRSPLCAISYIRFLSKKIRYLNAKLDGFASPNAYSKLALFLLENKGYSGSMTSLAELLGMSRMTLYRNLDILLEDGMIRKDGKSIVILRDDISMLLDPSDEII